MKIRTPALFLALGLLLEPAAAFADHIPLNILTEIRREANEPVCRESNRKWGTNYDCTFAHPDWVSCWNEFLNAELTYQQAVDLLGQLKVSNTYFTDLLVPDTNPYITAENMDILWGGQFVCE